MARKPTVLFICTGNSCRSQMAEALLRHVAGDAFEVLSGGTRPAGFVHPLALQTLRTKGISTEGLESKHLNDLADRFVDIAITVCDNASAECPTWIQGGVQVHWGLPDPSFHPGPDQERLAFSVEIADRLQRRIEQLAAMPLDSLSRQDLQQRLASLAEL